MTPFEGGRVTLTEDEARLIEFYRSLGPAARRRFRAFVAFVAHVVRPGDPPELLESLRALYMDTPVGLRLSVVTRRAWALVNEGRMLG